MKYPGGWKNVNMPLDLISPILEKITGSEIAVFMAGIAGYVEQVFETEESDEYLKDHPEFNIVFKKL